MNRDLIDPSDPLATITELIDNATEVFEEVIVEADPEVSETLEHVKGVFEAIKDRTEEQPKGAS